MPIARLLAGLAAFLVLATAAQGAPAPPTARAGVLDLSGWNFARDGIVALAGEWDFAWGRFENPDRAGAAAPASATILVPAPWNDASVPGKPAGADGYGTYRLRVDCREGAPLALLVPTQHSAARVYVNGRLLAEQGSPGESRELARPGFVHRIVTLGEATCPMQIVVHVSNYDMRNGGLLHRMELGTERQLVERRERGIARDLFAAGAIAVLSLLPLVMFFWRRKDRAPLWLGVYGLSSVIFVGMGGERVLQSFLAPLGWQTAWKLVFLGIVSGLVAFPAFLRVLYPEAFPRVLYRILLAVSAALALVYLVAPTHVFIQATPVLYALLVVVGLTAVVVPVRAALQGRPGAWLLAAGSPALVGTITHDLLQRPYQVGSEVTPWGLLVFSLVPVLLLARRFAHALTAEELRSVEQQQRVDLLVNATKAGLLDTDTVAERTTYSERLKEMLGHARDADSSDWPPFIELTHPDDRERIEGSFIAQIRDLSVRNGVRRWTDSPDFRVRRVDGGYIWVKGEAISVTGDDGRTLRHICSFVDITERKRLELELADSVKLREEVDRIGRHDLKTPLNSIIAIPRLLRESGRLAPEDDELVATVEQAGMRLLDMVNLSLDMFRMEQGNYPFSPHAVDLRELLAKVTRDLRAHADSKHVALRVEGPAAHAWGEELLCYSMFGNLTKNALEASPEGGVVRLTVVAGAPDLRVDIHNAGTVPEAMRGRFFEKYVTSGKSGGTGLGTYSARLMARTQGGDITLHTSAAEGTTLSVRLEAAPAAAVAALPDARGGRHRAPGAQTPLPALSVLLVDDDEFNLVALRRYLPSPPMRVAVAVNGRAALDAVMADPPDAVVMDIDMPVMGGLEAVAGIRAWEASAGRGRRIMIAMSAHDDPQIGARCLAAGFDRHLPKPVSRDALRRELAALAPPGPQQVVRVDADLGPALPGFLESRRALLEELARVVAGGSSEKARAIGHKLAGSFALYGFHWAAAQGRRIEQRARDGALEGLAAEVAALRRHLDTVRVEILKQHEEAER